MSTPVASTRNQSIDLIKIVAMVLVVALHTTRAAVCPDYPDISFVFYNLGVVAIPLFFMVSGYLLVGHPKATYKYSQRKILNIIRFVFTIDALMWIVFYPLSWCSFEDLFFNFFTSFIQRGFFWYFWYLGAMIVIFLLYPLINRLYTNPKSYLLTLATIMVIQNYAFISNVISGGEIHIIQTFRIWNWISYFMLGGLIKKISLSRKVLWISTPLLTVAALLSMKWLYPYINSTYCEYFYSSPLVIALAVSVFMLMDSFHVKDNAFVRECSSLFLAVYTIHPIVNIYMEEFFHGYIEWLETISVGCIVYWLSVLLVTCLIGYIVQRTPYLNRIFRL